MYGTCEMEKSFLGFLLLKVLSAKLCQYKKNFLTSWPKNALQNPKGQNVTCAKKCYFFNSLIEKNFKNEQEWIYH